MKLVLIIISIIFISGCSQTYSHRAQIQEGMTIGQVKDIARANNGSDLSRLYENKGEAVCIIYLLDESANPRPYKCRFSRDGILQSITLDTAYENSRLETGAAIIRSQGRESSDQKTYWQK
jgi:hypothetical protein